MFKSIRNIYHSSRLALIISLLIFALMFSCTLILSGVSANAVKKEAYEKNNLLLNKIMVNLENEFSHIEAVIIEFIRTNIVHNSVDLHIADDFERYKLNKSISQFIETNPYVDSIYIYYQSGVKVYYQTARTSGTTDADGFHDNALYAGFQREHHISGFTPERLITPDYFENEDSENKAVTVISFLKSLPVNSMNADDLLIVNLKEEHLNKVAQKSIDQVADMIIITDIKGNTVLSLHDSPDTPENIRYYLQNASAGWGKDLEHIPSSLSQVINKDRYFIINSVSSDNQMIYTIILPEGKLLGSINKMRWIMFVLSGAVLLIGIILSLIINRKYFRPVLGILHKLKSTSKKREEQRCGNIFSEISGHIDGIIKEKTELEGKLRGNYILLAARSRKEKSVGFPGDPAEQPFDNKWFPAQSEINNIELIQKVTDYIEEHFMDNIGLDTVAKQLYFSPAYLGKIFKEITYITFTEYLIRTRMKAAANMLTQNGLSVSRIAQRTGYATLQSFSKAFRNYYHCSPVEYRKRYVVDNL